MLEGALRERNEILLDNFRTKTEEVRIIEINRTPHPMCVRLTERLDAREILNCRTIVSSHWFVDAKIVRISMHENNRFAESRRFLTQRSQEIGEAVSVSGVDQFIFIGIRLHDQHDAFAIIGLGVGESLLHPGDGCDVAFVVLRLVAYYVAIGEMQGSIVVTTDNV